MKPVMKVDFCQSILENFATRKGKAKKGLDGLIHKIEALKKTTCV
jgi:hypothetical protein